MYLFLCSQTHLRGYGTYDSFVCVAPDEETARRIHPCMGREYANRYYLVDDVWHSQFRRYDPVPENASREDIQNLIDGGTLVYDEEYWPNPVHVTVQCLGIASKDFVSSKIICSSYNAG